MPFRRYKFEYLQIQLVEQVSVNNSKNIDKMLWEREKYWQAQLFTLTHGLNSPNEWYAKNRRGYRKTNIIFYHRVYSRLESLSCRNQLMYFFIITVWQISL